MRIMNWKGSYVFLLVMFISQVASAQTLSVSGSWVVSVPASTITEAGSDYTQAISSSDNQSLISLVPGTNNGQNKNGTWHMVISKEDGDWDSRLTILARRTGTGIPLASNNSITGGTSYMAISSSYSVFFSGRGAYNNIPIQYQVFGLSVLLPVKAYTTTIVYTFVN